MVTSHGGAIHKTGSAYGGQFVCELLWDTSPFVPFSKVLEMVDVEDADPLETLEELEV